MTGSNVFRRVYDWFTLADYQRAKEAANRVVVKRYSRGNILVQTGRYLDERKLINLSQRGDTANSRIQDSASRAKQHAAKR